MTANPRQVPADFKGALGVLAKPYTPAAVGQALDYAAACVEPARGRCRVPLCCAIRTGASPRLDP
jgi:hypothetical protein